MYYSAEAKNGRRLKQIGVKLISPLQISYFSTFNNDIAEIISGYTIGFDNHPATTMSNQSASPLIAKILLQQPLTFPPKYVVDIQTLADWLAIAGKLGLAKKIFEKYQSVADLTFIDFWRYLYVNQVPTMQIGHTVVNSPTPENLSTDCLLVDLLIASGASATRILQAWPNRTYIYNDLSEKLYWSSPDTWWEVVTLASQFEPNRRFALGVRFRKTFMRLHRELQRIKTSFERERLQLGLPEKDGGWVDDIQYKNVFLHRALSGNGEPTSYYVGLSIKEAFRALGSKHTLGPSHFLWIDVINKYGKFDAHDARMLVDSRIDFTDKETFGIFFTKLVKKKKGGYVSLLKEAVKRNMYVRADFLLSQGYIPNMLTVSDYLRSLPDVRPTDDNQRKSLKRVYKSMINFFHSKHLGLVEDETPKEKKKKMFFGRSSSK